MFRKNPASALAAVLSLVALVACGGGGSSSPAITSQAPTPVTLSGPLTGTATALQFNRLPVSAASATVTLNGTAATPAQLQPGVVIVASATQSSTGLTLTSVDVIQELEGPITAIDPAAATFVVLGVTVSVNALTLLEDAHADGTLTTLTLADFAVGNTVKVFGNPLAAGGVLATRVERRTAGDSGEVEIRGTATGLDTTAKTFSLGTTTVNYAAATVTGTLAEGSPVEVEGTLAGAILNAARVKVDTGHRGHGDDKVEAAGTITGYDAAAKTFLLGTLKVDFSSAAVTGTLADGATVEARGALSAADPTILVATRVEVRFAKGGNGSSDDEAKAPISAITPADLTLVVGGVTFWTDADTLILDDDAPLAFSALAVGDFVEVRALTTRLNTAGQPYATRIERGSSQGHDGSAESSLEGMVAGFDATYQTFMVGGTTVVVTASTTYRLGDTDLSAAAFWGTDRSGLKVEVSGALVTGTLTATEIRIKN